MIVWLIETRHNDYTDIVITASHKRVDEEIDTAEERAVDVIATPYVVEDLDEKSLDIKLN